MATSVLLGACSQSEVKESNVETPVPTPIIGRSDMKIPEGRMTPEALWAMGRIAGINVSPDGNKIVYSVGYYSVPENKSNREIFVMNADGSDNRQINQTQFSQNEDKCNKKEKIVVNKGEILSRG